MKKILYITLGCIGLGLGALGAALPLLPAFPFLLLAAVCFAKSSPRLHRWFIGTKLYKNNLESFVRGQGMTVKAKIRIMTLVTLTMAFGFLMMSRVPVGRIILTCVWVMHIFIFIFVIKTKKEVPEDTRPLICKKLRVTGMRCENCARRLECALDSAGNIQADVDFQENLATVYLKEPVENDVLIQLVQRAGYQVEQVWEAAS
ncbi:DUF454 family protein [Diplocloster agilis]|uniref:DUF454 family protein n=1 Tax=Diplocloster agilis TaxID=2850323 RepID=A0A949K1P0_9FIRM|nr:DUF454 family protein [Suonthocola fibrivorans]MBU9737697.1 DUF454 family protein [Diplocloster agilis]MBU9744049.1 DUF454 family protein [Diplocloster agilis]SCJ69993.1 Inner membrane protein ybaN [uncultured Clostridium sp.]